MWCQMGVLLFNWSHRVRIGCDGLTAVGVRAIRRIELFGPVGHCGELVPGSVELFDVAVEVQ